MGKKPPVTDADFEVVDGPYRVGDENRDRRGWFLTEKTGRNGEALWYKPPGKISKFIRNAGLTVYIGCIVLGFVVMVIGELL